ncbi:MAG: sulfite exporter TauE/SafE family protein [Salinivirgaceae bacterium]|nr:sulfite exporter TauE/SafE family protein [Salinivirgaceae bacterium]
MEFLTNLFDNSQFPIWSAFLLGLMTAISPCPLATNITAIGYLSKDISNRKRVFLNGLIYTLGRTLTYTILGWIIYFGANQVNISQLFERWGEKFLGPLLVLVGVFFLGIIKIPSLGLTNFTQKVNKNNSQSLWSSLLLGIVFALAFCPYSGVLYFGMLMPLTLSSESGLLLPIIYAIATGLPVIIFAYVIAFMLQSVGNIYSKLNKLEFWTRKIVAIIFIVAGFYYIYIFFIQK